jgi:hypothetical protein
MTLVAEEKKRHAGMTLQGDGGAGHDDGRASVTPHGVKRYGSRCCHDALSSAVVGISPTAPAEPALASTAVAPEDDRP